MEFVNHLILIAMLTPDKIISIFCIIDDIFRKINPKEDIQRKVSYSEIMITFSISL
jgi:hypothetical protein